ncbi:MAG TPA: LytTR family DNA-binding domain-containing protein [Bacillota bacterium]|nr:LytTR family DNA-binding domain-containing protein [Bacillota bacterium]
MERIRAIIADDNLEARQTFHRMLDLLTNVECIGEAANGEELVQLVYQEEPDVIFVDIDMPGTNGLDAAKQCKGLHPHVNIVFVTGHPHFALEAYQLSAVDYLLKPIDLSSVVRCIGKVQVWIDHRKNHARQKVRKLIVKNDGTTHFININDVIFIEKTDRKSCIHTYSNIYETYETLGRIYEQLPTQFIKSHRAYIINTEYASKLIPKGDTYLLYFYNYSQPAYVSRNCLNTVFESIQKEIQR